MYIRDFSPKAFGGTISLAKLGVITRYVLLFVAYVPAFANPSGEATRAILEQSRVESG
jgi:hypothetical protein